MGRTIREQRLARGMSLSQLAAAVGRSSSSVRRWERDEVPPAIGIIDQLAEALGLDPEELRSLRPGPIGSDQADADSGFGPTESSGGTPEPLDLDRVPIIAPPESVDESSAPPSSGPRPPGFVSDVIEVLRGATESWSGWIRGGLTAAVLIVMAIVLVWALSELASALGEIWDSFETGVG